MPGLQVREECTIVMDAVTANPGCKKCLSPTPEVLKPSPGLGDKNNQAPYLSRRSAFANSTVIRCRLSKNPSPPILH